jgi:hypothetical protein
VPLVGVADNQDWSVESVKFRVPVPVLVTLRFAEAGFAPPWIAAKLRLVGEIERAGEPVAAKP